MAPEKSGTVPAMVPVFATCAALVPAKKRIAAAGINLDNAQR
jgi:hypothetical protein